ncbi:pilus assembly PilX N-terminal domain-containing protein [Paenibacillus sp. N3/727]|uniref:pilus assembly PilX N-terminal domain-containing protein n=1 Tax=Paenibacillus sp. N3/727 TaxID=2925845 RepID=UPI001F532FCB|nr:pilus assembly PilX N-terminal domain-containing protein [Paenibacillus sp. N3/727]UNK16090.1 pilus assembly PilX N-terminal domain-containing protein [Paenibacillus sp. N3/727]
MVKNERGFALPMVLILVTALSILGMTLLGVSVSQAARTVHQEKKEQAFYIAKSGADAIASYIIENYNPATLTTTAISTLNSDYLDQDIHLGQGTFRAEVTTGAPLNPYTIIVKSTAKVGNVTNPATLTLEPDAPIVPMNHAIFASENIVSQGAVAVFEKGDVTAGKKIIGEIASLGGGKLEESYTGAMPPAIHFPDVNGWPPLTITGSTISQSGNYGDYSSSSTQFEYINVANNKDLYIAFNEFTPSQSINITGSGNGIVQIYANKLETHTSFSINSNGHKVILFVEKSLILDGSFTLNGVLLYAPNADYTSTNGSLFLTGAMITKNVTLTGASTVNYDAAVANLFAETRKFKKVKWSN